MLIRIITLIFCFLSGISLTYAADVITNDINIRDTNIGWTDRSNIILEDFVGWFWIGDFFFVPSWESGKDGILEAFTTIAFQIKNIMIVLAVIFLVVAIIKLLFSPNDEESIKKWKSNIIWVSVGIFVMQIAFSVWRSLILENTWQWIDTKFWWTIWLQIFSPIVGVLQLLASFAFLLMVVYAFYTIVGSAWDEEKLKKWRRTIIYGLVGFFLMRFPEPIIRAIYGTPNCKDNTIITIWSCEIENQNISGAVEIIGKIITYVNWFLMLVCVLLIIYAWWLVLISAWDEEKLKKAKSTILYVFIGLLVLIASHTIFRFFILQG